MERKRELNELVPERYRELVEAVPRGMAKEAIWAALALGALIASLLAAFVVPGEWLAGFFFVVLVVQRVLRVRSDRKYDAAMAALQG